MRGRRLAAALALAAATGLAVLGLALATQERQGTDSSAMALADTLCGSSKPEFRLSFYAPEPREERILFAAQAAIGAGLVGYGCLAVRKRRRLR